MKGRTWCISFEDVAKKDGDVQVKYKVTDSSGNPLEIRGTWEGYKAGDTPDKKAERFFNALNSPPYNTLVGVTRSGNTVCFQLKDNAPYRDINGVEVGDQSGQNFDIYDDPCTEEQTLEVVRFRMEGAPLSPGAEVRLGLGHVHPLARVATHSEGKPLTISIISDALVAAFNAIYADLGFNAHVEDDQVVIPVVPCKLGTRGGSNDTGLNYWLSMADPNVGRFSRIFDKPRILLDAIRLTSARLDLAGIPQVRFADPRLMTFIPLQTENGGVAVRRSQWAFTVVNNTNQDASDVHVTLAGTGGTLQNPRIIINPPGCGQGRASITGGNRVDVVWGSACVRPGDTVGILVDTDFVPLDVVNVVWTRSGHPIERTAFEGWGAATVTFGGWGAGTVKEPPMDCGTPVGNPVSYVAKTEGTCTVVAVDSQSPPPAGWQCRCFAQSGITSFSFTGPGFNGLWALGEEGAPLTNPTTFRVTNPATGEVFFVQSRCT